MRPRVLGIDPGTLSLDLCGLDDGGVFLDRSLPTRDALADPASLVVLIEHAGPFDLVAGPSGYGLPLTSARDLTDDDLRLAYLAREGEAGGIGGLRSLVRALAGSSIPMVLLPGVVHLPTVPEHRKINRIDMGTADKLCAAALAIAEHAERRRCAPSGVSLILLELGGAFTAALAVDRGRIVDGIGGTSGPIGIRSAGALDGEVAYLAGTMSKSRLFTGGAAFVAGTPDADGESIAHSSSPRARVAWDAYLEGAIKAVAALTVSVPGVRDIALSGRLARVPSVVAQFSERLARVQPDASVHVVTGIAAVAKQAAQGAAMIADGLAGGRWRELVETLGVRDASGSVLDHLHVVSREEGKRRLGIP